MDEQSGEAGNGRQAPGPRYTLEELSDLAGITPRTVRYYIAEGLLPAAVNAGPKSGYTGAHRDRLRLIARLKDAYVPLREIKRRLDGLTDDEISAALADPAPPSAAATAPTPPSAEPDADRLWRRLPISRHAELLISEEVYRRERGQVDAALALLGRILG